MTCEDVDQMGAFEKVTINNNSKHQHDKDACSPLCVCNCFGCQGFNINAIYSYIYFSSRTLIDKKIPEYKSLLTSTYFGSIWQPPQIT